MDDFATVQVLEGFGYLVDDVSDVDIFEDVFGYDIVEVCLDELENQVHIAVVVCLDSFIQFDDV